MKTCSGLNQTPTAAIRAIYFTKSHNHLHNAHPSIFVLAGKFLKALAVDAMKLSKKDFARFLAPNRAASLTTKDRSKRGFLQMKKYNRKENKIITTMPMLAV
jgi:hypothetical protein